MAGQRKGRVPVWVLVVALAAGAAILVGVLVGE